MSNEPAWVLDDRQRGHRAAKIIVFGLAGLVVVGLLLGQLGHAASGSHTNSPEFERVVSYCRDDAMPVFLAQHRGPINAEDPVQVAEYTGLINRCVLQRTGNNDLGGYMSGKPLAPDQPIPPLQPEEPYTNP